MSERAGTGEAPAVVLQPSSDLDDAGVMDLGEAPGKSAETRWGVRRFKAEDGELCRGILAGLSDWFVEAAVEAYTADLPRALTWVAVAPESEAVVGMLSLTRPQPKAFEVHLLAVARTRHGQGAGRALLGLGERFAVAQGALFMQVKTQAASKPDRFFEQTRRFYGRLGYEALFESDRLWGDDNPVVVLVKALA
jgi:GNAT superfamily N-acetyltransferase